MKINLCILGTLASASIVYGETTASSDVVLHDVTFQNVTYDSGLQNHNPSSSNFYLGNGLLTQGNFGVTPSPSEPNTIQGLYMDTGSGLKLNGTGGTVSVSYLYLAPSIKLKEETTGDNIYANEVSWGSTSASTTFSIASNEGCWLDINQDYGSRISTASMSGGTVYLNGLGHLNGTLNQGNTLVATAVTAQSTLLDNAALFQLNKIEGTDYTLVTRTLMTGDFSAWSAEALTSVLLKGYNYSAYLANASSYTAADLTKYYVTADSNGLSISYLIPEPTTAMLSLLALASLAVHRRR